MRRASHLLCLCVVALLPAGAWAADNPSSTVAETAAEKQRKALEKVRDLEIADQPLDVAVNQLREQTGVNFVIDQTAVPTAPFLGGAGVNPGIASPYTHLRISGRSEGTPVRVAVGKMLRAHNLTHVLVGDTVWITTADKATERQLSQPVSVNVEAKPLSGVLKQLVRETGTNLVLDGRSAKEGQTALTVRLDEVPLETAVEVLADEAGLKSVRLSNVLYVTSEARAEKLLKSRPASPAPARGWQVWPDGNGGFRLTPPAGAAGAIGFGGIGGLGGMGGIAGIGGGGFGLLGGPGGAAQPVPLTPPLPKAKQPPPGKPKGEGAPGKLAVKPGDKDKPVPKDKPEARAIQPGTKTPRSRRRAREPLAV